MPLHVVFSFDENDNSPLADLFNVFVKVNVGSDIPRNVYLAFLKAILKINRKYVSIRLLIRTDKVYESVNIEDILENDPGTDPAEIDLKPHQHCKETGFGIK